eukprot:9350774-Heterocapsa_arctica.AAC.1
MASTLRALSARTRLIGYGSNHRENDRQLDVADVCAFHLYAAWYPTGTPVDMNEVNQIPMIWDAYAGW